MLASLLAACAPVEASETPIPNAAPPALFVETESVGVVVPKPQIVRNRFVKVNLDRLLDAQGRPREMGANADLTLNLFPDVIYAGVIDRIDSNGPGSYSWTGHLKGIEFSEMTLVLSSDVFIAHIASPAGVYEVHTAGNDLYQVIKIDQTKFPREGNDISAPIDPMTK
jgi:hypothetical protein